MLVLARYVDEKIIITVGLEIIEIVVVKIKGDKVRLGIEAPVEYRIDREEIYLERNK